LTSVDVPSTLIRIDNRQCTDVHPDAQEATPMSRVQLALDVDDIDAAVAFYSRLFGAEPAKRRPGYANFAIAEPPLKLVLLENPGRGGSVNHLGVEVESTERVHAEIARLTGTGLVADEEMGATCCYATQDKAWLTGPDGERWEVYTVLADSATFGSSPQTRADAGQAPAVTGSGVCCGTAADRAEAAPAADPSRPVVATTCC
jgi:catechol 2,3-dioxygenase-like lactoylglutathione lyase family enzyme